MDGLAGFRRDGFGHGGDLRHRFGAVGERSRSFKAVSPGMLPPLGILFALFVAFTASQVWSDNDRANTVVDREASSLRTVAILAAAFPGEPETRLRSLMRSYIAMPSLKNGR